MKYVLILLVIFSTSAKSQQVSFKGFKDWETLLKQSNKERKKIFIYFHAPWCVPCRTIERDMFTDKIIYSLLDSTCISISINIDDTAYAALTKKYRVTAIPVMVFLNKDGYLLDREQSFSINNKTEFLASLIKKVTTDTVVGGVSNRLNMEYPNFYNQYFDHMPRVMPTKEQVDLYLNQLDNPYAEVAWDVKSSFSQDPNEMDNLVKNFDTLKVLYGNEVGEKISENYFMYFRKLTQRKDSAAFSKLLTVVYKLWRPQDRQRGFYFQSAQFFGKTGMDWPRFKQLVLDYNTEIGDRANLIFCELMYRTCPDKTVCDYMANLMEPIVNKDIKYKNYVVYATLLLRTGKNELSEQYFSKALTLSDSDSNYNQKKKQEEIDELKKLVLTTK